MEIYTIGFTKKTARQFFELIKKYQIEILIDIRLNNKSQLSGFTKGIDLEYFLSEICKCKYEHLLEYAPTKDILENYKKNKITWKEYTLKYNKLLELRGDFKNFIKKFKKYKKICLLCSESTADKCHRRLMAEIIKKTDLEIKIIHI